MTQATKLPIYGVPFEMQRAEIGAWCWGERCGKGEAGAIVCGSDLPTLMPCAEPDCPFVDRQSDTTIGDVDGRPVYLRKLRDLADEVPTP